VPPGHKWPTKKDVDAARDAIALDDPGECLISMAFDVRTKPVVIKRPPPVPAGPVPPLAQAPRPAVSITAVHSAGDARVARQRAASELLADASFCARVYGTLMVTQSGHEPDGARADAVATALAVRLQNHVKERVLDEQKRKSWCWTFAADNINVVAAILELAGYIRLDAVRALASATGDTLLRAPRDDIHLKAVDHPDAQGGYVYWDKEIPAWVRSGKVVGPGRGVGVRHEEHAKAAKLETPESRASKFYTTYPAKRDGGRCFDDLVCYIGVAWARDEEAAVCKETNGILVWSDAVVSKLKQTSSKRRTPYPRKKADVAGYLVELVLDLCINAEHNVSSAPGFEGVLGGV